MRNLSRPVVMGIAGAIVVGIGVAGTATAATVASESTLVPIEPCRLMDTRHNIGSRGEPIGARETHVQQVTGQVGDCDIPEEAVAVATNMTIVNPTADSYMSVFPDGTDGAGRSSSLNWRRGQGPTPNQVDTKLSESGAIGIYNNAGSVDVIVDVTGYYTASGLDSIRAELAALQSQVADLIDSGGVPGPAGPQGEQGPAGTMAGPRSFTIEERVRISGGLDWTGLIFLDVPAGDWWMDLSITPYGPATVQECRIITAERHFTFVDQDGLRYFFLRPGDPGIYVSCDFADVEGPFDADMHITVTDRFGTYELQPGVESISTG